MEMVVMSKKGVAGVIFFYSRLSPFTPVYPRFYCSPNISLLN